MSTKTGTTSSAVSERVTGRIRSDSHDVQYAAFLLALQDGFARRTREAPAIFRTNADPETLWTRYIGNLNDSATHECHTCRRFIQAYGGLVTIKADGSLRSALWEAEDVPEDYTYAVAAMQKTVEAATVTGVFLTSFARIGVAQTGEWSHPSVIAPRVALWGDDVALTPDQRAAVVAHNVETVRSALDVYAIDHLREGLRVIESEALSRSEKFTAPMRWLVDRREERRNNSAARTDHLLWRAVASAPDGFCHPRSTVVGTLLDDISVGLSFAEIARRWSAKLAPLAYQRPTAAPKAGTIADAEKLVATLGLAPSFARRFARLDECETVWTPKLTASRAPKLGVFGHLIPRDGVPPVPGVQLPPQVVTWEKFKTIVLPGAEEVQYQAPEWGYYIALTSAVNMDAPPIYAWDRDDARRPIGWYVNPGGAASRQWNVRPSAWTPVTAVVPLPNLWGAQPAAHYGEGVVIVLAGCVDTQNGSSCLFPVHMRSDLHGVRSVIKAHSRSDRLSGQANASACGVDIRKGSPTSMANVTLRVRVGKDWREYRIDRWD